MPSRDVPQPCSPVGVGCSQHESVRAERDILDRRGLGVDGPAAERGQPLPGHRIPSTRRPVTTGGRDPRPVRAEAGGDDVTRVTRENTTVVRGDEGGRRSPSASGVAWRCEKAASPNRALVCGSTVRSLAASCVSKMELSVSRCAATSSRAFQMITPPIAAGIRNARPDAEPDQHPRAKPTPLLREPLPLPCLLFRPSLLLLVLTSPLDHGSGENVMPDLEPGRLFPWSGVDRAEDPPLVELLENRLGNRQRHACVTGEVVGLVDDPRPRRRDQLVQHRAATARSPSPRALIASSRCLRTIRSAPPRLSSVSSRSTCECCRCSSAQRRDITSCKNGVSTRVCSGSSCSTTPPPAWPRTMFPARTSRITALTARARP